MKINWFTVIAQALNFLILVWLLKKFLYKPILNAVSEREKKITDELKEAEAQKASAQNEKNEFKMKNDDFDSKKAALLDKATADAENEKKQLMASAKEKANAMGSSMKKAFEEQQELDRKELSHNTQAQVFEITRKALLDLASESLEERAVNSFINRLKTAKNDEKQQFIDAFQLNLNAIVVKSAFVLPEEQRAALSNAINELLQTKTLLKFETKPYIISGIELSTNGYKLSWSFSEYLKTLQKKSSEAINKQIKPVPGKIEHVNT